MSTRHLEIEGLIKHLGAEILPNIEWHQEEVEPLFEKVKDSIDKIKTLVEQK